MKDNMNNLEELLKQIIYEKLEHLPPTPEDISYIIHAANALTKELMKSNLIKIESIIDILQLDEVGLPARHLSDEKPVILRVPNPGNITALEFMQMKKGEKENER